MTPTVTKELIIRLENNQIPVHEKSPPLSLSVKEEEVGTRPPPPPPPPPLFFFPVSSLVERRLFSPPPPLRGMTELYLTAGPSLARSAKKKLNNEKWRTWVAQPLPAIHSDPCRRSAAPPLSAPSTVNESHWASKGAINKQTVAHPLIARDRLFVLCFPSGSKCSNVTATIHLQVSGRQGE